MYTYLNSINFHLNGHRWLVAPTLESVALEWRSLYFQENTKELRDTDFTFALANSCLHKGKYSEVITSVWCFPLQGAISPHWHSSIFYLKTINTKQTAGRNSDLGWRWFHASDIQWAIGPSPGKALPMGWVCPGFQVGWLQAQGLWWEMSRRVPNSAAHQCGHMSKREVSTSQRMNTS